MESFTDFAADAQEFLRRSWTAYKKEKYRESAQVPSAATPEQLANDMSALLARASGYRTSLTNAAKRIASTVSAATKVISDVSAGRLTGNGARDAVSAEMNTLMSQIQQAETTIREVGSYLAELEKLESVARVIADQIDSLRDRISRVYEVIGLGLTAESLSHEIETIASQLAHRNDQIIRYIGSRGPRDSKLVEFTQHVKSAISGLRKQLTYLSPSLTYVRERREEIDVPLFLTDVYKHHLPRLSDSRISLAINRQSSDKFTVNMNRGKLIQIMDNLILNSKYWLEEDLRLKRMAQGRITIEVDKPYIRVTDNGRGVDPALEDSIFEPFVTAKGKGKGRGLGLYIVQQLLEMDGCSISLLPDRNKYDRRITFQIDLRSVLVD
jgi:signal transduction histidine kinase